MDDDRRPADPLSVLIVEGGDGSARQSGSFAAGSFTSISLAPPLVGFFLDRSSSIWRQIAETDRFCVNVLGKHQVDICVAWIDCRIETVFDIGDHHLVVGAVEDLGVAADIGTPLIFLRGDYHGLMPLSAD